MIIPAIDSMFNYVMLESEDERNIEMLKVIEQSNTNINWIQQHFSQAIANHQMQNKQRREKYLKLINLFAN